MYPWDFDTSSVDGIARQFRDAAEDRGGGSPADLAPFVVLQQTWAEADPEAQQRIAEAMSDLLDQGGDDIRAEVLDFWRNRSGPAADTALRTVLDAAPPWLDHANPKAPGDKLGRSLARALFGDIARRDAARRPLIEAMAVKYGADAELLWFLLETDPAGRGYDALARWIGGGRPVGILASTLGTMFGSFARARLLEVAALLRGASPGEQDDFLKRAFEYTGDPAMQARTRAAMEV